MLSTTCIIQLFILYIEHLVYAGKWRGQDEIPQKVRHVFISLSG